MTSVPIINQGASYYAGSGLIDAITQLQLTAAIADFTQQTDHATVFATGDIGPGSDHNLIRNTPVIIDHITGDMSNVKSLSFEGGQTVPPVTGSMWLNSANDHVYHGTVDLEATGGNVSSSAMSTNPGDITVFSDTSGIIIGDSSVNIDIDKNITNVGSILLNGNGTEPILGSIWLDSNDNKVYHGNVSLENEGNTIGAPSSIDNSIPIFDGTSGKILKDSTVTIDPMANMGDLTSLSFTAVPMIPVPGSLWLDSSDNHLKHGSNDLETTGDVVGPSSSVDSTISLFSGTSGKLIKDSPVVIDNSGNINNINSLVINPNVISPAPNSVWVNTGNNHLMHGSVDLENTGSFVSGPASAVDNDIAVYDLTTGKLIKDSGVLVSNVVQGPSSAINNDLAAYDLTTGKLIKDSGINSANVVQGPASAVDSDIAVYDLTTGKLIKDSGILVSNVVQGPASAVNNNLAAYDLTTGKLIKDSGINSANVGNVIGANSSVDSDIALFSGTNGKIIKDSGILVSNVVQGPASAVSGNVSTYNGTTGKLIQDSGILATNIVQGPTSVVSGNVSTYNGTTGKLIQDSGILASNIVQGPVSAVSTNLAAFNGTTGKLIQDSGISSVGIGNVTSIVSSTLDARIVLFNGTSGKSIKDSGVTLVNYVTGPGSATSLNVAGFNGPSGKIIYDSGLVVANVVQNTGGAVTGDICSFTPGGKFIQDSGILASNIVQGPASSVSGNFAAFNGTTGKLLEDSLVSIVGLPSGRAVISDVKAANTNGGTFTSGAWQTRTLNTIATNGNSGATLSANQFTLVAGTYRIEGFAPARNVQSHQTRIRNITDGTTAIVGESQFTQDASGVLGIGGGIAVSNSQFDGIITIASTKVFELQHQCSSTQSTTGFGIATNFGENCVYSKVVIVRAYQ